MLGIDGVGETDEAGEFGLGRAPRDAKPVTKIELSKQKEAEISKMNEWEQETEEDQEAIQQAEE